MYMHSFFLKNICEYIYIYVGIMFSMARLSAARLRFPGDQACGSHGCGFYGCGRAPVTLAVHIPYMNSH